MDETYCCHCGVNPACIVTDNQGYRVACCCCEYGPPPLNVYMACWTARPDDQWVAYGPFQVDEFGNHPCSGDIDTGTPYQLWPREPLRVTPGVAGQRVDWYIVDEWAVEAALREAAPEPPTTEAPGARLRAAADALARVVQEFQKAAAVAPAVAPDRPAWATPYGPPPKRNRR